MAHVFISFIHEEQAIATAIQEVLSGLLPANDVFISADNYQVFAGEIWLEKIRRELDEAKVVVLMLSPASIKRPWINFEAGAAWLTGKALIPVCFGGLTKGSMDKPYSGIQGVDLPDDLEYLVRSIKRHLNPEGLSWLLDVPLLPPGCRAVQTVVAALEGRRYRPARLDQPWDQDLRLDAEPVLPPPPPPPEKHS
jgi:hypothetical protein